MSDIVERVAEAIMKVETDDKISDYYKWAHAAVEEIGNILADSPNSSLGLAGDELLAALRKRT